MGISGLNATSPRAELAIGDLSGRGSDNSSITLVGGLLRGRYKVVLGTVSQSGWTGPQYPNQSSTWDSTSALQTCGVTSADGCLFDVFSDPNEHDNIAAQQPDIFTSMLARIREINRTTFSPARGWKHDSTCDTILSNWNGFFGPFLGL